MIVPTSNDILSLNSDAIGRFIADHASERSLSQIMKGLNADLLHGEPEARDMAARAIQRLGFPVHV